MYRGFEVWPATHRVRELGTQPVRWQNPHQGHTLWHTAARKAIVPPRHVQSAQHLGEPRHDLGQKIADLRGFWSTALSALLYEI